MNEINLVITKKSIAEDVVFLLTSKQLSTLKNDLENRKQEITSKNQYVSIENERESVGELSNYDNHPADMATELYEREKDFALEEHDDEELQKIDNALKAIVNGTYGICTVSGKEIPYERLKAIPTALTLKEYSPEQSIPNDRPVEEDLLEPAHGNTYRHRNTKDIRDYEDSFQEVARFGTSETPSDLTGDYADYDSLYNQEVEEEGFSEEYESFVATDIEGKNTSIYPSKQHEKYEERLDDEGIESPFGDVPYRKSDGYVNDEE